MACDELHERYERVQRDEAMRLWEAQYERASLQCAHGAQCAKGDACQVGATSRYSFAP